MFLRMLNGRGLGVWKTIPTFLRNSVRFNVPEEQMSFISPPRSKRMLPDPSYPSKVSLSLFKALKKVVFPEPERPIRTVMPSDGNAAFIPLTAFLP